jgi:Transcriptional regulator
MEKNRTHTEQRLIDATNGLITDKGFEKLGINAIAEKAGVDKKLIYRYFGSLDGLINECLKRNDFWANVPEGLPQATEMKDYAKEIFRQQIKHFRENSIMNRLSRWELSNQNDFVDELRQKRENTGLERIATVSRTLGMDRKEVAGVTSLITAGITYLAMLKENCRYYNGIDIQSDEGWEEIAESVDKIIDSLIQ